MPRPLVIYDYEGTLGEIFVEENEEDEAEESEKKNAFITLRPGVINSLQIQAKFADIVLATRLSVEKTQILAKFLATKGVSFKKIFSYDEIVLTEKGRRFPFKNLQPIYDWAKISSEEVEDNVIVVEDISLSPKEIEELHSSNPSQGNKARFFCRDQEDPMTPYTTYGMPLPDKNGKIPNTLFLSALGEAQAEKRITSMNRLDELLLACHESAPNGKIGKALRTITNSSVYSVSPDANLVFSEYKNDLLLQQAPTYLPFHVLLPSSEDVLELESYEFTS